MIVQLQINFDKEIIAIRQGQSSIKPEKKELEIDAEGD